MTRGTIVAFLLLSVVVLVVGGCAPGNERWNQELSPGHTAGFWAGIWHGLIIVITFIVSLFTDRVGLYEAHNSGWRYNLGFLIGLFFSIGGGFRFFRKRKWQRKE